MISVAFTSPLTVSTGCMLTIPLSGVTDALLWHDRFPPLVIIGSAMVVLGFALLTFGGEKTADEDKRESKG